MIDLGKESLERFSPDQRHVSGLTLSLSKQAFVEVRDLIEGLRKRCIEIADNDREISQVYQINVQAFPVTKPYLPDTPQS